LFCALGLNVAIACTGPGPRTPNRFAG
jgi:hypothetical protein